MRNSCSDRDRQKFKKRNLEEKSNVEKTRVPGKTKKNSAEPNIKKEATISTPTGTTKKLENTSSTEEESDDTLLQVDSDILTSSRGSPVQPLEKILRERMEKASGRHKDLYDYSAKLHPSKKKIRKRRRRHGVRTEGGRMKKLRNVRDDEGKKRRRISREVQSEKHKRKQPEDELKRTIQEISRHTHRLKTREARRRSRIQQERRNNKEKRNRKREKVAANTTKLSENSSSSERAYSEVSEQREQIAEIAVKLRNIGRRNNEEVIHSQSTETSEESKRDLSHTASSRSVKQKLEERKQKGKNKKKKGSRTSKEHSEQRKYTQKITPERVLKKIREEKDESRHKRSRRRRRNGENQLCKRGNRQCNERKKWEHETEKVEPKHLEKRSSESGSLTDSESNEIEIALELHNLERWGANVNREAVKSKRRSPREEELHQRSAEEKKKKSKKH